MKSLRFVSIVAALVCATGGVAVAQENATQAAPDQAAEGVAGSDGANARGEGSEAEAENEGEGEGAEEEGFPVSFSHRPMTLPHGMLTIDNGLGEPLAGVFFLTKFPSIEVAGVSVEPDPVLQMMLGAGFGITDDLQVDAVVAPVVLSPDSSFGRPRVQATYRFLRGSVELGARAAVWIPTKSAQGLGLQLGVPVDVHTGGFRIFGGAFFNLEQDKLADETLTGIEIPVYVSHNFGDNLFLGAFTGVLFESLKHPSESFRVPFAVFGGYSLGTADGQPLLDVGPYFSLPYMLTPGETESTHFDVFQVGIHARFFHSFAQ